MTARRLASMAALLAAVTLAPAAAHADPCAADDTGTGMPTGPLAASLGDGALGLARRVCPRTELMVAAGGGAIIDVSHFYGYLHGGLNLAGSWRLDDRTELFGRVEAVRYDYVQSSLSASHLGLGFTSVGATRRLLVGGATTLGVTGRLVLPTAVGLYRQAVPLSLDAGVNGAWRLGRRVTLGGEVGLLTGFALATPAGLRLGAAVTATSAFHLLRWLDLVAEVSAGFGYTAPVDVLAVAAGVRTGWRHAGLELSVRLPLAGRERSLAAFDLGFSWRF